MTCFASVASAALLALVACKGAADADKRTTVQTTGEEPIDPKSLVKLSLVANVDAIAPGGELNLGAVFDIKDGWHIYWINPGETGLKTTATFSGPAGFNFAAARFPGPVEFKSPGDIVSYGYEHSTVAFGTVTVPAEPPESVTFKVKGSWLACAEVCVPGKANAELTLSSGEARPANDKLLAPQHQRLPRPFAELSGAKRDGANLVVPGVDVAFFPLGNTVSKVARIGDATRVTLPSDASGVLRVGDLYYAVP